MINKYLNGIIFFSIKSVIIGIIIFIGLSFWGNKKVYDFLFTISPNSDSYFTKFINNKDLYCEGNKLVLLDDIFKYGINKKSVFSANNDIYYGNKKIYNIMENYNEVSINKVHSFIYNNKLYCKGNKLILGNIPGILEGYCGKNEGIEIKQEKPINECY